MPRNRHKPGDYVVIIGGIFDDMLAQVREHSGDPAMVLATFTAPERYKKAGYEAGDEVQVYMHFSRFRAYVD